MKKFLSIFLALLMIFNIFSLSNAVAAEYLIQSRASGTYPIYLVNESWVGKYNKGANSIFHTGPVKTYCESTYYWNALVIKKVGNEYVVDKFVASGVGKNNLTASEGGFILMMSEASGQHKNLSTADIGKYVTLSFDPFATKGVSYANGGFGTITIGASHKHTYGEWKPDGKGNHVRTCLNCTSAGNTETAVCTNATPSAKCTCDVCGGVVAHAWIDANCTEAKTCSVCGEKEGTANGHSLGEYIEEVSAQCEVPGVKGHYNCSVCKKNFDKDGNEITDLSIPQKNHDYAPVVFEWSDDAHSCVASQICGNDDSHVVIYSVESGNLTLVEKTEFNKAPTCTEKGENHFTATVTDFSGTECSEDKIYYTASLGHEDTDADGKCDRVTDGVECGATLCIHTGDNIEIKNYLKPTCDEEGYEGDILCLECNNIRSTGKVLAPLGHLYKVTDVEWSSYEDGPSCKVIFSCQRCEKEGVDENAGTILVNEEAYNKAPTCTEDGYKIYTVSSTFDGAVFDKENNYGRTDYKNRYTFPKEGHRYNEAPAYEWEKNGESYDFTATFDCSFCDNQVTIEKSVAGVTTEANCEEDGKTVYAVSDIFTDENGVAHPYGDTQTDIIEALGHDFSGDYNNPDDYTHNYACKNCDKFGIGAKEEARVDDFEYCEFKNHKDNGDDTHTGTCECGNESTGEHYWNDWKSVEGELSHLRDCRFCGAEEVKACSDSINNSTETEGKDCKCDDCGRQLEHVFDEQVPTTDYFKSEADCVNAKTYYMSCLCGEKGSETFTVGEANGHKWSEDYIWAEDYSSCTLNLTCEAGCTETLNDNEIDVEVVLNQSCTDDEMTIYTATFESEDGTIFTKSTEEIKTNSATGHDWTDAEGNVNATYEWAENGLSCTVTFICKKGCTEIHKDIESELALETEANCQQTGKKTYKVEIASNDGKATTKDEKTIEGELGGHSLGDWIKEVPSTCENPGTKGHFTCFVCKKYFDGEHKEIADLTIEPHGHEYAAPTFKFDAALPEGQAPLCTAEQVCIYDDAHKLVYAADKVNAELLEDDNHIYIAETCTTKGQCYYVASVVGYEDITYTSEAQKFIIPALGHYDSNSDGKCDRIVALGATCGANVCEHEDKNYEIKNQLAPTCTEEGYTGDKFCLECKTIRERGEAVAAKGHAYKVIEAIWAEAYNAKATPTCSVTFECQNDRAHKATVNGIVTLVEGESKVPTCTENGIKYYGVYAVYDTAVFNYENPMGRTDYKKSYITEKSGHDFTITYDWKDNDGKACDVIFTCAAGCSKTISCEVKDEVKFGSTCENNGTTTYSVSGSYTDENGETYNYGDSIDVKDITAKSHDFSGNINKLSGNKHNFACKNNCGEFGVLKEKNDFVECNFVFTTNGDNTHTAKCICDNVYTEACRGGEATCIAKAVCDLCKKEYGNLKAHDFSSDVNTLEGMKHNFDCATEGCSAVGVGSTVDATVDCHGFKLIEEKKVTCTEGGYEVHKCGGCDNTKRVEFIPLGHVDVNGNGVCDNCGMNNSKLDFSIIDAILADGKENSNIPEEDRAILDEIERVIAEFKETEKTTQPVIDEYAKAAADIVNRYANCKNGHDLTKTQVIASTCITKGYTAQYCVKCSYTFKYDETDFAEHNYEATYIRSLDCRYNDKIVYNCTAKGCTATYTESVEGKKGAHTYVLIPGLAPTCETTGYSQYTKCTVCGETTFSEFKPALGHYDDNNDGNCDRCGRMIASHGKCTCLCHSEFWLAEVFFKIVLVFCKLFKINRTCDCGIVHW